MNGDFSDIIRYPPVKYKGIISLKVRNHPEIIPKLLIALKKCLAEHPDMEYYKERSFLVEVHRIKEVIEALLAIEKINLQINWEIIINLQITNLKNGINKVGIPDLIILENVLDNKLLLFSEDKHFKSMSKIFNFKMFEDTNKNRTDLTLYFK